MSVAAFCFTNQHRINGKYYSITSDVRCWDKYIRYPYDTFISGTTTLRAQLWTAPGSGMQLAATIAVPPWCITLHKLSDVGKMQEVLRGPEVTVPHAELVLDSTKLPNGCYFATTTGANSVWINVLIHNAANGATIPTPKFVAVLPHNMPGEWGSDIPNTPGPVQTPMVIEWKGLRAPGQFFPVPQAPIARTTTPMTQEKYWSLRLGLATPGYVQMRYPATTPYGGVYVPFQTRYDIYGYDGMSPDSVAGLLPDNPAHRAPFDHFDGNVEDGALPCGVSGYQLANGDYIVLDPVGRITRIDKQRTITTLYGWRCKQGALRPMYNWLIEDEAARIAYVRKSFDFIGSGPSIPRAWQLTRDIDNEMVVYVVGSGDNTITKVDLTTGTGTRLAGAPHERGTTDGPGDLARFDNPRGILMMDSGPYKGKLIIADEHNCSLRLLDPKTREVSTLVQSYSVPMNLPFDFYAPLTTTFDPPGNKVRWGAPGPVGSVQPFANCKFAHPCQLGDFSDGKLLAVCHDTYERLEFDLVAKTVKYHSDIWHDVRRLEASRWNWPTLFVDKLGWFGRVDDIFDAIWWQDTRSRRSRAGLKVGAIVGTSGPVNDCGSDKAAQNQYPRGFIGGHDGSAIISGDAALGAIMARPRLASDPMAKYDYDRYRRGHAVYAKERNGRSMRLLQGVFGHNWFAGVPTPELLGTLNRPEFLTAMEKMHGAAMQGLTEIEKGDLFYFWLWSTVGGVERMRAGLVA